MYDNRDNQFILGGETRLRRSEDTAINAYDYHDFEYNKKGLKLSAFYNNPDRFYVSAGYGFARRIWRKEPFGFEQALYFRYSLSQNAFAILYEGIFRQLVGKWDLALFSQL